MRLVGSVLTSRITLSLVLHVHTFATGGIMSIFKIKYSLSV